MIPLLVIAGPTAVGKSALALEIASSHRGEIISADSLQVYRYFDIGSAKPSHEEQRKVPHHLVNSIPPDREFTAADFNRLAFQAASDIHRRGKLPILCGGTGLYIRALLENLTLAAPRDEQVREKIRKALSEKDRKALYEELKERDPDAAKKIHPHDHYRIGRALEVLYSTGRPLSHFHNKERKEKRFKSLYVILNRNRKILYHTVNQRVDEMIKAGLLKETENILNRGYEQSLKPFQAIGYHQMTRILSGKIDKESAIEEMKRETRRFAKRQLTWFRKVEEGCWIDMDGFPSSLEAAEEVWRQWRLFLESKS